MEALFEKTLSLFKNILNESEGFLACCYDTEDYYQETNYVDKDGELRCNSSGCEVFATEEEAIEWADDNKPYGWWSFAMPANIASKLEESIDDFESRNRQMHKFAKRKHDDTGAKRKHSGNPYFEHPESVAKIVIAYGGDDVLVDCALAHDLIEDAGVTVDDLHEKFGPEVASIVDELTNDNAAIKRLGKETYMNNKLANLSDEALFVKLADMNYNLVDYSTKSQSSRMLANLLSIKNRRMSGNLKDLYDDTLDTAIYINGKA